MKITFSVAGAAVSVFARSTFTGQDSNPTEVAEGGTGTIELEGGQQLVITPIGLGTDTGAVLAQVAVETDANSDREQAAPAPQLNEATDDQVRTTVESMGDTITKTQSGAYKVDDVNTALEAAGFAPINAARRDTIWPPA